MANAPLSGQDSSGYEGDLHPVRTEIFFAKGLDSEFTDLPVEAEQELGIFAN
jgi:hypothetical protein